MAMQLGAPVDPETDGQFIKNSFETGVGQVTIVNNNAIVAIYVERCFSLRKPILERFSVGYRELLLNFMISA